jgi:hypothetical protein
MTARDRLRQSARIFFATAVYCSSSETVSATVLLYSLNLILKRSAIMALHSLYGKLPGTSLRQS